MFRFTIRELVLVTLVVAMGVAWWIDRVQLESKAQEWRHIAGGLQHILMRHEVGVSDNRLWVENLEWPPRLLR